MKSYREWIEERRVSIVEDIKYHSIVYENKEVRIYSHKDTIYCNWYINGELIKNPKFPEEIALEIYLYLQTLFFKQISDRMLYGMTCTMEKYLPYLEDGDKDENESLKYVEIKGEIKL